MEFTLGQLQELANILLYETKDIDQIHYAIVGLRKLLSLQENNPIQEVIDLNLAQQLVKLMQCEEHPHIMLEATWCCCNISTGSTQQISRLNDKGILPVLIKLLNYESPEIFEQASWCVANIAADCNKFKNLLIEYGVISPLVTRMLQSSDLKTLKQTTWALANICRGKNNSTSLVQSAAPAFIKVILLSSDIEILNDALMGLSDICNESIVSTICSTPLLAKLKEISKVKVRAILIPLLRILAYVTNGDDVETQKVIDNGFVQFFYELLQDPLQDKRVQKEVLWIISNLTIGTAEQIYRTLIENNYYDVLVQFANHNHPELKKEAVWALCNSSKNATKDQIMFMVDKGLLD